MNAATPTPTREAALLGFSVETAKAYVETVTVPECTFKVLSAWECTFDDVVYVETTGTNTETGETFPAEWCVWVEPERGDSSGLYGEW